MAYPMPAAPKLQILTIEGVLDSNGAKVMLPVSATDGPPQAGREKDQGPQAQEEVRSRALGRSNGQRRRPALPMSVACAFCISSLTWSARKVSISQSACDSSFPSWPLSVRPAPPVHCLAAHHIWHRRRTLSGSALRVDTSAHRRPPSGGRRCHSLDRSCGHLAVSLPAVMPNALGRDGHLRVLLRLPKRESTVRRSGDASHDVTFTWRPPGAITVPSPARSDQRRQLEPPSHLSEAHRVSGRRLVDQECFEPRPILLG